jgi:hypothetical protein
MRREDCMEMFGKIPEGMHPYVNLVLRNGFCLAVSMVARYEETYVVFSGREGGTSDEGRGFFVPYDEISYIRIEKPIRVGELKSMYGETGYQDMEDRLDAMTREADQKAEGHTMPATAAPLPVANGTRSWPQIPQRSPGRTFSIAFARRAPTSPARRENSAGVDQALLRIATTSPGPASSPRIAAR